MAIKTLTRRAPEGRFKRLEQDVLQIRSLIISLVGEDAEGAYQPQLAEKLLRATQEKPSLRFTSSADFLK